MIKKHYEIPESELILVKYEEAFLTATNPNGGIPNVNPDDVNDDSGIWGGNN